MSHLSKDQPSDNPECQTTGDLETERVCCNPSLRTSTISTSAQLLARPGVNKVKLRNYQLRDSCETAVRQL